MKILFVITGLGLGGAERVVITLAEALVLKGYQVKIAYLKGNIAVDTSIECISLGFEGANGLSQAIQNLKKLISKFQPDVVHAHLFHACLLVRWVRYFIHIKYLICTAHSKQIGGILRKWLYRITDQQSDLNTNVSQEATDFFIRHKAFSVNQSLAVTNGINTEKFNYSSKNREQLRQSLGLTDEQVFMAVGRFNVAKDYPNLIEAFAQIKQHNRTKLYIIGDGELRPQIESMIAQYQLKDDVVLLGVRSDVAELLSVCDVFVLASAWEGFGLVVAEAMSCRRVVVATNCGGIKEVLGNSEWLVEPKNSDQLAHKMQTALHLTLQEKRQLGEKNRHQIQQLYSVDAMVTQWINLYQKANI